MQHKDLFHNLNLNYEVYKELHARTADSDLKITQLFANGKNAVQISMAVPCAESTVYRTRERVTRFLHDELPRHRNTISDTSYIHNSVARGTYHLNLQSYKLYYLIIHAQQHFKDHVEGKMVHAYVPGLRNRNQREVALLEMNELVVVLDENPKRNLKVFEFVAYDQAKYYFKFTKDALPYYDRGYAFLKMIGIGDWPE